MSYSLTWLPQVLLDARLKVAPVEGWQERGHGDVGPVRGVMCHHTGGRPAGNMPALNTLVQGRPGLLGPLSQLGLGRDGTYYVIAAGRAYHAGKGVWQGLSGNRHFIGIEAENTGLASDQPWPVVQLDAYRRGVAAILAHLRLSERACIGHKEYAPARKVDPSFDMDAFRADVRRVMDGQGAQPALIPAEEPSASPGQGVARPTLRRGRDGEWVARLQHGLGLALTGRFDARTEAAVRVFQRLHQLVPDGIVGPTTWRAMDAEPDLPAMMRGQVPAQV